MRLTNGSVGAPGITVFDAADGSPSPSPFVAWIRHVYAWPSVTLATTTGSVTLDAVPRTPPSGDVHVAVNPLILLPPSPAGGAASTEIDPGDAVASSSLGASARPARMPLGCGSSSRGDAV